MTYTYNDFGELTVTMGIGEAMKHGFENLIPEHQRERWERTQQLASREPFDGNYLDDEVRNLL